MDSSVRERLQDIMTNGAGLSLPLFETVMNQSEREDRYREMMQTLITRKSCASCPDTMIHGVDIRLPMGSPSSPLMILRGPYVRDDDMDKAGDLILSALLSYLPHPMDQIYRTNVRKCSMSKSPKSVMYGDICFALHFGRELQVIQPKVLLVLGEENSRLAQNHLGFDPDYLLKDIPTHPTTYNIGDFSYQIMFGKDPTELLKAPSPLYPAYKNELWNVLRKACELAFHP